MNLLKVKCVGVCAIILACTATEAAGQNRIRFRNAMQATAEVIPNYSTPPADLQGRVSSGLRTILMGWMGRSLTNRPLSPTCNYARGQLDRAG